MRKTFGWSHWLLLLLTSITGILLWVPQTNTDICKLDLDLYQNTHSRSIRHSRDTHNTFDLHQVRYSRDIGLHHSKTSRDRDLQRHSLHQSQPSGSGELHRTGLQGGKSSGRRERKQPDLHRNKPSSDRTLHRIGDRSQHRTASNRQHHRTGPFTEQAASNLHQARTEGSRAAPDSAENRTGGRIEEFPKDQHQSNKETKKKRRDPHSPNNLRWSNTKKHRNHQRHWIENSSLHQRKSTPKAAPPPK